MSFNIALAVVDFPHPDSPTRPKLSPLSMEKETLSTAFTDDFSLPKKSLSITYFFLNP